MKKKLQQAWLWIKAKLSLITPGKNAIKGAAIGLVVFTAILYTYNAVKIAMDIRDPWVLVLVLGFTIAAILAGYLVAWLIKILFLIPKVYKLAALICLPLLFITVMVQGILVPFLLLISSLLGAAFFVFRKTGYRNLGTPKKVVTLLGLTIGLAGFAAMVYFYYPRGMEMDPFENAGRLNAEEIFHIQGDSPSLPGSFKVNTLTYGSGKDRHRREFGENVNFQTEPVNGVAFLDNWSGISGWWRKQYWGFDDKALPLNARVWYPEGDGPFPLALIVHGNHSMTDFSDGGYAYLGELLASRGIILASVDQNFINGNWSDIFGGLENENDARGWLLLEHLKVWHQWNETPGHQFQGKIDTDKIALIGHSRGGEAVAHAVMFNDLEYFPDDASIRLDYNFNIRSIIAIAPVDGQYQAGETPTRLKNVNYLVLHGGQDADVSSYMGSMQFERISFSDSSYHFKTGLYIYGANHGQFNSSWGDNDYGIPFKGLFNLGQLMPEGEQQEVAKVYISAFLESTLRDRKEYLPLFADARHGRNWLPESVYLNQFEDSNTFYICNYDEDFDVRTGTMDGVTLAGENLSVWREQEIKLKRHKKGTRGVFLGWHYDPGIRDSLELKSIRNWVPDSLMASYTIQMDPADLNLDPTSVFVFTLAEAKENPNPKSSGKWVGEKDKKKDENEKKNEVNEQEKKEQKQTDDKAKKKEPKKPLDLTIVMEDLNGQSISFPLSRFSALQRELEVRLWKLDFLQGNSSSEKIFQKYCLPLAELSSLNPAFDPIHLSRVSLVFDQVEKGVIVLDQVGFMKNLADITMADGGHDPTL